MKGHVDVKFYVQSFNGVKRVNAEAIISDTERLRKANDKRYADLSVAGKYLIDFETLQCLAIDAGKIDQLVSKEGITFENVPAEFNRKKYPTKDEYYHEIKVHLGNDEFYVKRCFFLNRKHLHMLSKINTNVEFTDSVAEDGDLTPDDLIQDETE
jgi:hypothetical protein